MARSARPCSTYWRGRPESSGYSPEVPYPLSDAVALQAGSPDTRVGSARGRALSASPGGAGRSPRGCGQGLVGAVREALLARSRRRREGRTTRRLARGAGGLGARRLVAAASSASEGTRTRDRGLRWNAPATIGREARVEQMCEYPGRSRTCARGLGNRSAAKSPYGSRLDLFAETAPSTPGRSRTCARGLGNRCSIH